MKISILLNKIKNNLSVNEKVSLRDILVSIGDNNYFVMFLMAVLSNIPTPVLPLISCFFGFLMIICSFQILINKKTIIIPSMFQKINIKKDILIITIHKISKFFQKIENFTKVRMVYLFMSNKQKIFLHVLNVVMSILIVIPIPFISFLPAIAVMLIIFGLLSRDGLYVLLGSLTSFVSIIIYVSFFCFIKKLF